MRTRALAILLSTVAAAPAFAADLPSRGGAMAPAPIFAQPMSFTWTGFYAGLNAGYGWGSFHKASSVVMAKPSGGVLGAQLGYNYQFGNVVVGVEGDLNWSWLEGNRAPAVGVATTGSLEWYGTLRGRVGFAADRALIYATGGYAGGQVKAAIANTNLPGAFAESTSSWRNGWALGGGIEYAFTNNITAKAEYLYMNLGSDTLWTVNLPTTSGFSANIIRAGVNYKF